MKNERLFKGLLARRERAQNALNNIEAQRAERIASINALFDKKMESFNLEVEVVGNMIDQLKRLDTESAEQGE